MRYDYEPMPVIDGGNFYLRTIKKEDYKDIFDYGKDPEVTRFLSWGPMENPSEAKWTVEHYYFERPLRNLPIGYAIVWKQTGKMIGVIDFHTIDHVSNCGEIGYVLNRYYQGMGIMTMALKLMIEVGFNVIKLNRIEIKHLIDNIASMRVIQKCDFRYEGTLRKKHLNQKVNRYADVLVYSILKEEYEKGELKWQSIK